jgi:hypothetical protein
VIHAGGEEDCDIWDLFGSGVQSQGTVVRKPLLIIAEDVPGVALGIDYGDFTATQPALTPGQRFTATDGRISGWPDIRLVNEFGVPGLEEFVQLVDTLPNFSGDVIVSTAMLTGTFVVPEPASSLLLYGAMMIVSSRRIYLRQYRV